METVMLTIRASADRGRTHIDWLDSRHSFSFGDYHDPRHHAFRALRVINDDWIAPAAGFPMHGHRDMEIVSWMLAGRLQHADSMGNGSVISAGELQRMTAGAGVNHSEHNPSAARLLQIWLYPRRRGLTPSYDQKAFPAAVRDGRLALMASGDGRDGSVTIQADADLYGVRLSAGESVALKPAPGRGVWVQATGGSLLVNGARISDGDGVALENEPVVALAGPSEGAGDALVFDLA
jgi:quercetin 2,3-dioxygenase